MPLSLPLTRPRELALGLGHRVAERPPAVARRDVVVRVLDRLEPRLGLAAGEAELDVLGAPAGGREEVGDDRLALVGDDLVRGRGDRGVGRRALGGDAAVDLRARVGVVVEAGAGLVRRDRVRARGDGLGLQRLGRPRRRALGGDDAADVVLEADGVDRVQAAELRRGAARARRGTAPSARRRRASPARRSAPTTRSGAATVASLRPLAERRTPRRPPNGGRAVACWSGCRRRSPACTAPVNVTLRAAGLQQHADGRARRRGARASCPCSSGRGSRGSVLPFWAKPSAPYWLMPDAVAEAAAADDQAARRRRRRAAVASRQRAVRSEDGAERRHQADSDPAEGTELR